MARYAETIDSALDLLATLADAARELPTAGDLAATREDLGATFEAMAELHPDRRDFWHGAADAMDHALEVYWRATHESPTGDLEAVGGAVAESGQLATGEV